jgi:hypothetical protein
MSIDRDRIGDGVCRHCRAILDRTEGDLLCGKCYQWGLMGLDPVDMDDECAPTKARDGGET